MTPDPSSNRTELPASEQPRDVPPRHVAIIMDGNNRWAKSRGLSPQEGHSHGAEAAWAVVDACVDLKLPYLTLFAFSSENWLRPKAEVRGLMALFLKVLRRDEISQLHSKGVRIRFIGNRQSFSSTLQRGMRELEKLTQANTGLSVFVAMDYGGQWDIAQAAAKLIATLPAGADLEQAVTPEALKTHLSLSGVPDPDLCIRTGGEVRLSNFVLWQLSYTELYFCDTYWPDFTESDLRVALLDFAQRQRRFGGQQRGNGAGYSDDYQERCAGAAGAEVSVTESLADA